MCVARGDHPSLQALLAAASIPAPTDQVRNREIHQNYPRPAWEKTVPYYEGEFKRNNYQGKGEYHYGDGDYYKGDWKDGKYHGQGASYSKRLDRTWVGEYKNDEKVDGNWVRGEI